MIFHENQKFFPKSYAGDASPGDSVRKEKASATVRITANFETKNFVWRLFFGGVAKPTSDFLKFFFDDRPKTRLQAKTLGFRRAFFRSRSVSEGSGEGEGPSLTLQVMIEVKIGRRLQSGLAFTLDGTTRPFPVSPSSFEPVTNHQLTIAITDSVRIQAACAELLEYLVGFCGGDDAGEELDAVTKLEGVSIFELIFAGSLWLAEELVQRKRIGSHEAVVSGHPSGGMPKVGWVVAHQDAHRFFVNVPKVQNPFSFLSPNFFTGDTPAVDRFAKDLGDSLLGVGRQSQIRVRANGKKAFFAVFEFNVAVGGVDLDQAIDPAMVRVASEPIGRLVG